MVVLKLSIRYMSTTPTPSSTSQKYLLNCAGVFSDYVRMYVSKVICAALVKPQLRVKQMRLSFLP